VSESLRQIRLSDANGAAKRDVLVPLDEVKPRLEQFLLERNRQEQTEAFEDLVNRLTAR